MGPSAKVGRRICCCKDLIFAGIKENALLGELVDFGGSDGFEGLRKGTDTSHRDSDLKVNQEAFHWRQLAWRVAQ